MKKLLFIATLCVLNLNAQESLNYQLPPEEILELVDVTLAPSVILDDNKENMILLYREAYKNIEDLSREELRLAGLRIDPITNISSRKNYYNNIKIKNISNQSNIVQIVIYLEILNCPIFNFLLIKIKLHLLIQPLMELSYGF